MSKRKKSESAEMKTGSVLSVSIIVFLLDRLSDAIYQALTNGWFGKIFTSYSKEQRAFEQGFLKHHFTSGTKLQLYVRWLRQHLSRLFESSFFFSKIGKYSRSLLSTPLKSIGNFFLSFGIYTILVFLVRELVPGLPIADEGVLLVGIGICIAAIPMLLSKDNLGRAIGKSILFKAIFLDSFGFREELFEIETKNTRAKANGTVLLGMLCGILTLFFDPLGILLGLLILIGVVLVFIAPEIGVLIALFALPFFSWFESPAIMLGMLILLTSISYFIKLIRGKRIFKLELMDLAVLLFLLTLYFSGAITAGGRAGYNEVLLSCVLTFGYFLVVNLMRTKAWLHRCVLAIVSSGTVVAVIGILQYLFGEILLGAWVDTDYFFDIKGRVTSLFENPNVLATYLVAILPFALFLLAKAEYRRERFVCFFSVVSILLCIVFTWSRGAWLAAIVIVLLFALIYSKKTLRYLFFFGFAIPFLSFVLPQSIVRRFGSIGDLADSSTTYRLYTWRGSWNAIQEYFWGGVGYGNTAYETVYPRFAYAGMEAAEHSHNLLLQLLFGVGIGGLLIFLAVLFLQFQMNLEYMRTAKDTASKWMVAAAICAVIGVLVMGLFDFVWYNYRIFFLFWAVLALGIATTRVGNEDQRRRSFVSVLDQNSATIDLDF